MGDLLTLHGTVEEVEGNTQLMGAELVEFVNFWMATPIGTWLTADQFQDEQYEGHGCASTTPPWCQSPTPTAYGPSTMALAT